MHADIIILFERGLPTRQFIVEDETTAEAQFDSLAEQVIGDDYEDVVTSVDYGMRLVEANEYLQPLGENILWLEQVEVNQYKNES